MKITISYKKEQAEQEKHIWRVPWAMLSAE